MSPLGKSQAGMAIQVSKRKTDVIFSIEASLESRINNLDIFKFAFMDKIKKIINKNISIALIAISTNFILFNKLSASYFYLDENPKTYNNNLLSDESNNILEFHLNKYIFDIPSQYILSGSNASMPNNPPFFVIRIKLPEVQPAIHGEIDNPNNLRSEPIKIIRVSVQSNQNLSPINMSLGYLIKNRNQNYSIITNGIKRYTTLMGDIYVKENNNSEPVFVAQCWLDTVISPRKACTVYEQFFPDISIYYSFDKNFVGDSYKTDLKIRELIQSFLRKSW